MHHAARYVQTFPATWDATSPSMWGSLRLAPINPVLTYLVCHDSHCCSVIQNGETALDMARVRNAVASRYGEVIKYLEEFGK